VTLPADDQILVTREFDAPKHLVYKAFTTPELVRRWWHANRGEMTVAEIDLRVGGKWRYVMVADGGMEVGFHGEYREIVPNERIVSTETFEGLPEGVSEEDGTTVNTATFAETDGRTTLTLLIQAPSRETRDAIVDSGMEAGLQDALDNLELALQAAGDSEVAEGFRLVRNEFVAALARVGIEPYSPQGERFDPSEHEAMSQLPVEGVEAGTVASVYQQGYRIDGTVLRPARVVVAA